MKEPIKILQMIGSLNVGGSQTMILNIYEVIDKTKIQFDFIIDHDDHLYYKDYVESMGARVYTMPSFNGKNYFDVRKCWERFFQEHAEYKILHSHVRSYASVFLPIAKKNGVKTIIHSHSTSNGKGISSIAKHILQYPLRYQADFFMGCSKSSGEWLFGKKIIESQRFKVIANGVDINKYLPNDIIRNQIRNYLNIPDDNVVFGHIGRFHEAKNFPFLIELFSCIYRKNRKSKLLLVGDGGERSMIEELIQKLSLSDAVIMLGMRNDVPNILQAMDCFLFPSKWEGLPVTLVEAQASGIPCLVSDCVTREVALSDDIQYLPIDKGVDCWLESLKQVKFVRNDNSLYIKKAGFDIETSADEIAKIYFELL